MIIKRMMASFGKLHNAELRFEDGLNIIYEPNESGKSTWCAFIRVMLYGLNTSERDKAGFLSDKTKYRPWGEYPMEGLMDIIWKGKAITLTRKSKGTNLMGLCEAIYTGTGEPCPELSVKAPGDILIGAPEQVFKRSAYIRRPAMALETDSELEKRISALVTSGDEDISYIEASDRLSKWHKKRSRKPSGLINIAEKKKQDIEAILENIERENAKLAELRAEKERLKREQAELKACLEAHKINEQSALSERLKQQRLQEEELATEIEKLTEKLSLSGKQVTLEDIKLAKQAVEALSESDDDLEKAADDAAEARKVMEEKRDEANSGNRKPKYIAYLAFSGIFLIVLNWFSTVGYLWIIGAVFIALAFMFFSLELSRISKTSVEYKRELKILESENLDAQSSLKFIEDANKEVRRRAKAYLSRLDPKAELRDAQSVIMEIESMLFRLEQLKLSHSAIKRSADELEKLCPQALSENSSAMPQISKDEAEHKLIYTQRQLEEVSDQLAMAVGSLKHLGDPLVLSSEVENLKDEIESMTQECDALELAADMLLEANAELSTRFSPIVSELAGKLMNRMTQGRYTGVLFDKGMNFTARTGDEIMHRDIGYLSEGTVDQLYLAARLAVSELILSGSEPCPIILDDVLASFDDERARKALELLREMSASRQILFFTCRDREKI